MGDVERHCFSFLRIAIYDRDAELVGESWLDIRSDIVLPLDFGK